MRDKFDLNKWPLDVFIAACIAAFCFTFILLWGAWW